MLCAYIRLLSENNKTIVNVVHINDLMACNYLMGFH